ncbi:MAG: Ca-activated chloride channel family protein [Polyangiales bacterium]|jgi:Ca-activated chloride channel family protein
MMKSHTLFGFVVLLSAIAAPAHAWDPFVTPNSNVETGNERMSAGDAAGALAAYDLAARQHPEEPRVALDRGLALLASGDLPAAREAFVVAADPDADDEIRAAAYYDLGLAFYQEGDTTAGEEDHEASQGFFREAADAFRRSLRVTHGNRDAAWNLELALRRIREEEEAQEQQEEQERQEQEEQEEGDEDGDPQDGEPGEEGEDGEPGEDGDPQDGDEEGDPQDGEDGDPQDDGEQGEEGDEQEQDQQGGDEEGEQEEEGEDPQEQNGEEEGEGQDSEGGDEEADQHPDQGEEQEGGQELPQHVERVLDALQDNEQNLERARARARAAREGRRVLRDW